MKEAKLIKDVSDNFNGTAALYKLTPALSVESWDDDEEDQKEEYVVVSAVNGWAHETYIFASDESGKVKSFSELDGSYKGGTSHHEALSRAGYLIA